MGRNTPVEGTLIGACCYGDAVTPPLLSIKYTSGTGYTTIITREAQEPMNPKNFAGLRRQFH